MGAIYRPQHEFIFYCNHSQSRWFGDKTQSDVWSVGRRASVKYNHPTQKPVEISGRAIANSSQFGDIILDMFGGSGSTLIACEKTGRKARLIELMPKYCDLIVRRWQNFTGKKAILQSSGELFSTEAGIRK